MYTTDVFVYFVASPYLLLLVHHFVNVCKQVSIRSSRSFLLVKAFLILWINDHFGTIGKGNHQVVYPPQLLIHGN